MIPRLLVPVGAKPPAADAVSTRRRPTTLDDRKLVPSTLPIVQLDGKSTIPSSLPLESIAARVVVPRDVKPSEFVREEREDLPLQPTDLDERVIVPQGAAPPEIIEPIQLKNIPTDLVETDVFMTGEVNLLNKETPEKDRAELIKSVMSFAAHALFILFLLFEPKIFPPHAPTQEENELARRQMTILLPPGALDELKTPPRPRQPPVTVNPKVLRRVAPPVPKPEAVPAPTPTPKQPEKPKELPSAPTPQPQQTPPKAQDDSAAKQDAPKQPLKLETPQQQQPTEHALLLPKSSLGGSLRDSIRESSKMSAPTAVGGGGQVPSNSGIPGGGSQAQAFGNMELLTPTQGVDFNEYLRRVYIIVKRNWFSVMPESVRLGDKGVVALQFRIMKNGIVPDGEPVRLSTSGKEPLDRAAVSSIRASSPFEPLPPAFSGPYIELRFTYFYNIQPNYGGQ